MLETMEEHPEERHAEDAATSSSYHTVPDGEAPTTAVIVESPKEEKTDLLAASPTTATEQSSSSSSNTVAPAPTATPAPTSAPPLNRKTSVPVLRRLSTSVFRRRRGSEASDTSGLSGLSKADSDLPETVKPWSRNKSEFPNLETHGTKSGEGYAGNAYVYADVGVSNFRFFL